MKKKNLHKKTKQGILWSGASSAILFVTRLGTSMILARLLFPEDFGLMGIATVITQFAKRLTSFGFNLAVVQRKDLQEEHLDTIFAINLFLVFSVTATIYFSADLLAVFFNNELVAPIMRVVSVLFIIRGLTSINQALLMRKMKFKELAFANVLGETTTFVSPVFFALAHYGVWSLVWGRVLGASVTMVLLFYHTRWYPTFKIRIWALKDIFSFGFWIFVIRYLTYFINKLDYILIGKFLGASQLGFYERAYSLMDTPRSNLQGITSNVLFSAYSQIQDDDQRIVNALKRVITSVAVMTYGIFIWMYFAAPGLITIMYGPKWINSIEPVQIMCFSGLIYSLTILFFPVINAKSLVAKRAICQFIYLLILGSAILAGMKHGINGVAWSVTISSICFLILILLLISSHLPFSIKDFILAQRSACVYGSIQVIILLIVRFALSKFVTEDSMIMLLAVSGFSCLSYLGAHWVLRFEDVQEPIGEMFKEIKKFQNKIVKPKVKKQNESDGE